ncbi:DUF883 domain-containing protein [Variovorax boronicumulans]|uniref:DUF883 domain-containing protein n=1 Tax=Variovorax boronicumulans TaxID=436515 RepID=UPI0024744AE7|nr:hypothetical protein [Variovorax boronicumulans]
MVFSRTPPAAHPIPPEALEHLPHPYRPGTLEIRAGGRHFLVLPDELKNVGEWANVAPEALSVKHGLGDPSKYYTRILHLAGHDPWGVGGGFEHLTEPFRDLVIAITQSTVDPSPSWMGKKHPGKKTSSPFVARKRVEKTNIALHEVIEGLQAHISAEVAKATQHIELQARLSAEVVASASNNIEAAADDIASDVLGVLASKDLDSVPHIKALRQRIDAKLAIARELAAEKIMLAAATQQLALGAEARGTPSPSHNAEPGYDAAVTRGAEARTRLFNHMLSSERVGKMLGVTRETVNTRRKDGLLLGLTNGGRSFRYPEWQWEERVAQSMPELLRILKDLDSWAQYLFFTQANPLLDGRSPLDCLRAGDASVMSAAISYAAEMA